MVILERTVSDNIWIEIEWYNHEALISWKSRMIENEITDNFFSMKIGNFLRNVAEISSFCVLNSTKKEKKSESANIFPK